MLTHFTLWINLQSNSQGSWENRWTIWQAMINNTCSAFVLLFLTQVICYTTYYTHLLHHPLGIFYLLWVIPKPHSPRLMELKVESIKQRIPHLYHQIKVALRVWRRDGSIAAIVAPRIRHVIHVNGSEKIGGFLLKTPEKVLIHKIRGRRFLLCAPWRETAWLSTLIPLCVKFGAVSFFIQYFTVDMYPAYYHPYSPRKNYIY